MENNSPVVYTYNYKNMITITRSKEGVWNYHYMTDQILDYVNDQRKQQQKDPYNIQVANDLFDLGQWLGATVTRIIKYCVKSYNNLDQEEIIVDALTIQRQ